MQNNPFLIFDIHHLPGNHVSNPPDSLEIEASSRCVQN